ncbi:ribbon-helix-helix domain-containing protein [Halanaeroarchaeum sp. HSR-CO]|uniref:ribbon-helix-helix domain-containing protein n=1 Tax=Halanaeroarchaeum sp. HSR-CO TaxID=2866382 RepID=UPI00217D9AC3|nr:ribbon-helix-helix domain-containing protein [Halanaeroarchaeum sp. HSR-CO]
MSTTPITARVDEDLAATLDDVIPEHMTRSEAVAAAVERFIEATEPADLDGDLDELPDTARRGYRELLDLTNGGGRIDKLAADPALAEATSKSKAKAETNQGPGRSALEVAVLNPLVNAGLVDVIQGIDHVAYHVRPLSPEVGSA